MGAGACGICSSSFSSISNTGLLTGGGYCFGGSPDIDYSAS